MHKVNKELEVGDLRNTGDLPSMYLGYRSYGGGSGEIWATQADCVEFSVHGRRMGYYYGMCQAINPARKSITMLIVKGETWGDFKTGNAIEIKADNIGRYHKTDQITEQSLLNMAEDAKLHIYQNELFKKITKSELEEAYRIEFKEISKHFLGEKAYEFSEDFFNAYQNFIKDIRESKSDLYKQPSKKILAAARKVQNLLKIETTNFQSKENTIIPDNLTPSQSSAFGAICGALVGDAAGGVLEFLGGKPNRSDLDRALAMQGGGVFSLAPGQITDDGELTLCLLRALADKNGNYDPNLVARYYIDWAYSQPFDIGMATSNALRVNGYELADAAKIVFKAAGDSNKGSKANGALMRITPLAVASAKYSEEDAVRFAIVDSRMTHPHVTCGEVNAAYVLAIRHLILNPDDSEGAVAVAYNYLKNKMNEAAEWMENAIDGDLPDAHPQAGYVRIAFTYAFFHLKQRSSFRVALSDTLARGGDTDTNACIVGGLIGAYRGINSLLAAETTRKMIYPVMMCDPSLGQKRPEVYHADNALQWLSRLL
jgi:ADP-ribosyl-[dinitrogen reductase] hydrolase